MTRSHAIVATLAFVAGSVSPALAAACRDGKGELIKCANAAPTRAVRCKGANGKFAKCGTAVAKPI